jgi:hypothetical protein
MTSGAAGIPCNDVVSASN